MLSSSVISASAAVRAADDALTAALTLTHTPTGDGVGGVGGLGHEELTDLVRTLTRLQARADALLLAAVGEVDARGTHTLDGALTAGAWLRATARQTPGQAARTVRTARTLRSGLLPNTGAALAAGDLTGAHAAVIADAVRDAPPGAVTLIEPEAVATAVESDVSATAHLMRAFQDALDPDAADEAAVRRYQRAGITLSPTVGGSTVFSGTADETTGAVIAAAIHAAGPPVRGDDRSAARRRLDALADICRTWLDQPSSSSGNSPVHHSGTGTAGATDPGGTTAPTRRTGKVRTGRHRTQLIVTLHRNAPYAPAAPHESHAAPETVPDSGTTASTGSSSGTYAGSDTGTDPRPAPLPAATETARATSTPAAARTSSTAARAPAQAPAVGVGVGAAPRA